LPSIARLHYHKRLTETYYISNATKTPRCKLGDEFVAVKPGQLILIRPGSAHRAIGKMTVLIVVLPKFDPEDEWFD